MSARRLSSLPRLPATRPLPQSHRRRRRLDTPTRRRRHAQGDDRTRSLAPAQRHRSRRKGSWDHARLHGTALRPRGLPRVVRGRSVDAVSGPRPRVPERPGGTGAAPGVDQRARRDRRGSNDPYGFAGMRPFCANGCRMRAWTFWRPVHCVWEERAPEFESIVTQWVSGGFRGE